MEKTIFNSSEFKAEIILSVMLEQNFEGRIEISKKYDKESETIFKPDNLVNVAKLMGKLLAQNSELIFIYRKLNEIKELRNQSNNQ